MSTSEPRLPWQPSDERVAAATLTRCTRCWRAPDPPALDWFVEPASSR